MKKLIQTKRGVTVVVLAVVLSLFAPAQQISAQAFDPSFDPNTLIADSVFSDTETFGGAAGVQKFLESKNSVLANTSPEFLVKLKEPQSVTVKSGLNDPQPSLPRLRSAAELIWDAAKQSGINPQVLLVTLQKEQGLITARQNDPPERLQRALDFSMGFGCPDSTGCGPLFSGFYFQLFGNFDAANNRYLGAARSLMAWFNVPEGRGPNINGKTTRVGEVIELQNTLGGFDGVMERQTVMLQNRATAALYRYTPHVFNGNYNFQKYFTSWFKYPNGTLMKLSGDSTTYIIQNGSRLTLPSFVAAARGLDLNKVITVSPTEVASYPLSGLLGPADNTVVIVPGSNQKFVFLDNVKRPASDFVITQRKLNPAAALVMTPADDALFTAGPMLTPTDGTVVRGSTKPEVYLVAAGKLQLYSAFTFAQYGVAKQVSLVPDAELELYPKNGFVPPKDGTIFKAANSQAVYEMFQGSKHPFTAAVFKNRGVTPKGVAVLSADEVASFPTDGFARPKDKTFFTIAGSAQLYYYREGAKRTISAFVAKQQKITSDYTFSADEANTWSDGTPVPPRNNTIVKGDGDATVYIVLTGQLRPLTYPAYQARKITPKKISVLPQAEVDAYAKGDVVSK